MLGRVRLRGPFLVALACIMWAHGCADTLPEEDKRIYAATPSAKLSADILWKDYAKDAQAADALYWGRPLEVSGRVTAVTPGQPHLVLTFGYEDQPGVQATILDDESAALTSTVKVGDRVTLRCYCEGLDGFVKLKSCIAVP